jgi:hypothetical protein
MQNRSGSELLYGELINPLPLDLLDGMLVFRNWAYRLPTRLPAGGRLASVDSLNQKPFRWQLTRQRALEDNATKLESWDPAARNSLDRVAEMLMFHDAVGGIRYTTLQHNPLSFLDLSHVLTDDRCVLMGRLAEPFTEIASTDRQQDGSASQLNSNTLTYIRLVLPVKIVGR